MERRNHCCLCLLTSAPDRLAMSAEKCKEFVRAGRWTGSIGHPRGKTYSIPFDGLTVHS